LRDQQREDVVRSVITAYVGVRTPRQIADYFGIGSLSREIVRRLDEQFAVWRKWSPPREAVAKSAVGCWIPLEDLRAFLNEMPGPTLTPTDVAQRLRAFCEEECEPPNEALKDSCLEIYEDERTQGTELVAIIGRLREHIDHEEVRLMNERWDEQRRQAEEKRRGLEQSFLAGEDCRWTPVAKSLDVYCRVNGRAYRLAAKEGQTRNLFRLSSVDDANPRLIGKYANQTEATKAVAQVAYQPEPRWP
jgi:hypothetical protein